LRAGEVLLQVRNEHGVVNEIALPRAERAELGRALLGREVSAFANRAKPTGLLWLRQQWAKARRWWSI